MTLNPLSKQLTWNPLRGLMTAVGAGVLLCIGVLPAFGQTPAGTVITNTATVSYTTNEIAEAQQSASVSFTVGRSSGLELGPQRTSEGLGGTPVRFAHTIANRGNVVDTLLFAATTASGWMAKVYLNNTLVTGPVAIQPGESLDIVAVIAVPLGFKGSARENVDVTARSRTNNVVVRDVITAIQPTQAILSLFKAVDPARAEPGQKLHYSLEYRVSANGRDATSLEVRDVLPANVSFVPGSLTLNDASVSNAGEKGVVAVVLGNVAAGGSGVLHFDVVLDDTVSAGRTIVNEATLFMRNSNQSTASAMASTLVVEPSAALALSKQVDREVAAAGDTLSYTITYQASGLGLLSEVVINDVLPDGVTYLDGVRFPFTVGNVARNASGKLQFRVTVGDLAAGSIINNSASADYTNRRQTVAIQSNVASTKIEEQPATLRLHKTVDQSVADAGTILNYTITYDVVGSGSLQNVSIGDVLPAGLTLVSGRTTATFAQLKRDAHGEIRFSARIKDDVAANTRIANVAFARFSNLGTQDSIVSDTAVTTLVQPQLSIDKRVLSAGTVWFGDTVRYQVVVRNRSAQIPLRNVVVADTIPAAFESEPRIRSFQLGDLQAGDSAVVAYTVKVGSKPAQDLVVINTAYVAATHASGSDTAAVTIRTGAQMQMSVELTSDVLNVSQGDIAPLVAKVTNTGSLKLNDVIVELLLPEGTHYVPGTLVGADSLLVENATAASKNQAQHSIIGSSEFSGIWKGESGGRLVVRLRQPLDIAEAVKFRYSIAVIAPKTAVLQNASRATAENQTVFSNEAALVLRTERNRAVETSVVLGNIFVDANGNGRMDEDEKPMGNVDVWSEDGAVSRSDALGKFSFSNIRPGTHVFRLDPATLPAGYAADTTDDGLVRVRVTGWNSPHILFALHAAPEVKGMPSPAAPVEDSVALRAPIRATPLLSDSVRAASKARSFLTGPAPEIFGAIDGMVIGDRKVFIGVRAEAGSDVALFRGDSLIRQDKIRADGVYDFLGVSVQPGPNHMRVRVINSWNQPVWDSVLVHVSGAPARLNMAMKQLQLSADGKSVVQVRALVLDKWGVPVVNRPYLTVEANGAMIATADAYPSAVGTQVRVDADGYALIAVRAGLKVMRGELRISGSEVRATLPLELVAPALPLMVIGAGEIGFGKGAAESFAALTARGKLDDRTSLTVSVDSRRVVNKDETFARAADPLSEGIYPMLGDASQQRVASAAHSSISARLQRGLDYVAFGDVQTGVSAEDVALARYTRSITGASAEVTTGRVKWTGFGALTAQALQQVQLRGRGVSGPYEINNAIIAGTEQVQIEIRDRDNPQQLKSRRPLTPYIDYQIDYVTGAVLLKQALPAVDGAGNPVFLVITAETRTAAERKPVWGGRVETRLKLAQVGANLINDYQGLSNARLLGLDVTASPVKGVRLHAEVAHSAAGDSSGIAGLVSGDAALFKDALKLNGRWSQTGNGFGNPSNLALQTTTQDLQLGAGLRVLRGELRFDHSWQNFETQGVSRSRTSLTLRQPVINKTEFEARLSHDGVDGTRTENTGAGEFKLTWNPTTRFKIWGESRSEMWTKAATSTGNYIGAGAALQVSQDIALEARHLAMLRPNGNSYSITNIGVRSNLASGSQAWGSYQIVGGVDAATSAAVVGLNNRWNVGKDLRLNTLFERRVGVDRAPVQDAVRALPFPQQEQDYWSGSIGAEYVPQSRPYRLSLKTERKQGSGETLLSGEVAGDYALNGSLGLLSRSEFSRRETGEAATFAQPTTEHKSSIFGLALRPASNSNLNGLVELRWVSDLNPRGAQLLDRGGSTTRLIGAAEMIWNPSKLVEVGGRYATRRSAQTISTTGVEDVTVRTSADFVSMRADLKLAAFAALRAESRLLSEHQTANRAWDVAPAVVLRPIQGLEISAGRRWGALQDTDFAVNGGEGWFVTMGVRMTEASLPTAAAFWRNRIGR